jgi:RNAse (barnase) inhibitor barstar
VRLRSETVAPFRLNRDEYEHDLPWRLMQNGPVTLYRRREYFEEDIGALRERGFVVRSFDCREWTDEFALHEALRVGLGMPGYTGHNFDALSDSLSEIEVPEESGMMVALDNVTDAPRADVLLDVLASTSRWWLLFGRIFGVLARTDNPDYGPPIVGAMRPDWNGREWLDANRGR